MTFIDPERETVQQIKLEKASELHELYMREQVNSAALQIFSASGRGFTICLTLCCILGVMPAKMIMIGLEPECSTLHHRHNAEEMNLGLRD